MTTTTPRRRGFAGPGQPYSGLDQPELSLDVYRIPAPVYPADDTADQVSRVLASLGSTAANLAAIRREERLDLDTEMVGLAGQRLAERRDILREQVRTDPGLPVHPDDISGYVSSLVENEIAGSGFEGNERAARVFRLEMTSQLMSAATGAQSARLEQIRQENLLDKANAYLLDEPSVVDEKLRQVHPAISDETISAYRTSFALEAASLGREDRVNALMEGVNDPAARIAVFERLRQKKDLLAKEVEDAAFDAAEKPIAAAIADGKPHLAETVLAANKDSLTPEGYLVLQGRVREAKGALHREHFDAAKNRLYRTLFTDGPEAAEREFDAGVANGTFTEEMRIPIANAARSVAQDRFDSEVLQIGRRALAVDPAGPEAKSQLERLVGELDVLARRLESTPVGNSPSFSLVTPGRAQSALGSINAQLTHIINRQAVVQEIERAKDLIGSGARYVPRDAGDQTAEEIQAGIVAPLNEQAVSAIARARSLADPVERAATLDGIMQSLGVELERMPTATLPAVSELVRGIPGTLIRAAREQTPEGRAAAWRDAELALQGFRSLRAVNREVAYRHVSPKDIEAFEYVFRAMETLPANDEMAIQAALTAVSAPDDLAAVRSFVTADRHAIARRTLKKYLPGGESMPELVEEVSTRIAVYATGLGMSSKPDRAAAMVGESLRNHYKVRKGELLLYSDAATGAGVNPDLLEQIMRRAYSASGGTLSGDVVLSQRRDNGMWILKDRRTGQELAPSLKLTGDDAVRLLDTANEIASSIADRRSQAIVAEMTKFDHLPTYNRAGKPERPSERSIIDRLASALHDRIMAKAMREGADLVLAAYADAQSKQEQDPLVRAAMEIGREIAIPRDDHNTTSGASALRYGSGY